MKEEEIFWKNISPMFPYLGEGEEVVDRMVWSPCERDFRRT